ncbi:MAG: MFS transporter [Candidatus Riflebacteria bacterium]|nr:MFS transporter [Candidatus Riflebacteria bacterium]
MIPFVNKLPEIDRKIFRIDSISSAYYGLYLGFFLPFVPVILKRMHADYFQMGICMGIPFLALIFTLPILKFFNGYKAIKILCYPMIIFRPIVILITCFSEPWIIIMIYFVNQYFEGIGLTAYTRVLRDMYSDAGRSCAMGYVRSFQAAFQIVGALLSGMLIDQNNSILAFSLAGISGLISAVTFLQIFSGISSPVFYSTDLKISDIPTMLKSYNAFFWLNVTVMLYGFGNLLMFGIIPTYLVEKFDISYSMFGSLTSITNLTLVLGFIFMGRFASRKGPQRALFLCYSWGIFIPWLFMFAPTTSFLVFPYLITGIQNAGFDMTWTQLLIASVPKDSLPAYASVYVFLMGLRGFAASLAGNVLQPITGSRTLLAVAGLFMLSGLISAELSRKHWVDKKEEKI